MVNLSKALLKEFQNTQVMPMDSVNRKPVEIIVEFHTMEQLPKVNPESEGKFSVQVILYDKDDLENVYVGHYDFELEMWIPYSENQCDFACWCYPPNPNLYLQVEGRANRKGLAVVPIGLGKPEKDNGFFDDNGWHQDHICKNFRTEHGSFICNDCGKSKRTITV